MSIQEQNTIKEKYYSEAMRYMANAKSTLVFAKKDGKNYQDDKNVKTACGRAYNGILKALDGYFLLKGVEKKKGRKSTEYYHDNAAKMDKKLNTQLHDAYEILHLSGYYDGITNVAVIKEGFEVAYDIIKRIEPVN
jgi:small nuclear ribonucleoprotein (snRNP)-like protein